MELHGCLMPVVEVYHWHVLVLFPPQYQSSPSFLLSLQPFTVVPLALMLTLLNILPQRLSDYQGPQPQLVISGHEDYICTVPLLPDGREVVTGL